MKKTIFVVLIFSLLVPFVEAQNEGVGRGTNRGPIRDMLPMLPSHDEIEDQPAYFPIVVSQTINFTEGWNWFSTYIEKDPVELLEAMETALGENGLQIKSKNVVTAWDDDEEEWDGGLQSIGLSNGSTYMLETNATCTVTLQGNPSDPADYAISLNPKAWTWIGFPCAVEVDIEDALAGFEAKEGDQIKSKTKVSSWDEEEEEWSGGMTKLTPGTGYMFYSNSTEVRTLVFSTK